MSNYYGDDFGDRMEADQLMESLRQRARAADKDRRTREWYTELRDRSAREGVSLSSWTVRSGRKGADAVTISAPGDEANELVGTVWHPDGRIEGRNADKAREAIENKCKAFLGVRRKACENAAEDGLRTADGARTCWECYSETRKEEL